MDLCQQTRRWLVAPLILLLSLGAAITVPGTASASGCNTAAVGSWYYNCTVSQGAVSNYVVMIQYSASKEICPSVNIDGNFGPMTLAAVKCMQRLLGVTPDGIVGPNTWSAMQSNLFYLGRSGSWSYWTAAYCTTGPKCNQERKWVPSGKWYLIYYNKWVAMNTSPPGT